MLDDGPGLGVAGPRGEAAQGVLRTLPGPADERPEWTAAIRRRNALVHADPSVDACIIPTRGGMLVPPAP